MKPRRIFSLLFYLCAFGVFVCMLVHGEYVSAPTREALSFCGSVLIPSLFVYMVLSAIIMEWSVMQKIGSVLGYGVMLLAVGTLCGAPVGAKRAVDLYKRGEIGKRQAEYYTSFTNNAGVSFVVGYAGKTLLHSTQMGFKLFSFQLVSSLIVAAVMKKIMFGKEKIPPSGNLSCPKRGLAEIISDSGMAMLNICSCAVFFTVISGAVARILNLSPLYRVLLSSVLEFSSGISAATVLPHGQFVITAFAIGFTGCSVAMQVKMLLTDDLSIVPYITGKILSCAIMTALAFIFG